MCSGGQDIACERGRGRVYGELQTLKNTRQTQKREGRERGGVREKELLKREGSCVV
jgi:hypothetical protein